MKTCSATTNIKASPEAIWKILTDAPNYPAWDPWAIRIEGTIAAGAQITAYTKLSPKRAFPVKVTEFVPGQTMTWTGGMPFGLFKGVRTFTLSPKGDGSIDFTVREDFSGPLLPLFAGSLPDMTKPFADFVAGLKARAEGT
jgi:hypothetical protein